MANSRGRNVSDRTWTMQTPSMTIQLWVLKDSSFPFWGGGFDTDFSDFFSKYMTSKFEGIF